jgi:glycosyltransferase involved in cell wall biosynthesis
MSTDFACSALTKIMLVTNQLQDSPSGGRELLCKLNYQAVKDIFCDRLILFEIPKVRINSLWSILGAFQGHIDGLTHDLIVKAIEVIKNEKVCKVFVDGSNFGEIVKVLKQRLPNIEVITFFHNVESKFFLDAFKQARTIHALAVLIVNYKAEKKSVRFSDKIICLSERDSLLIKLLFGRSATHISPMALRDNLQANCRLERNPPQEKYALFVGGLFYANQVGIGWFIKFVVNRIDIKVYIVGKGFEDLKATLDLPGKVEVVGSVDDLSDWYLNSHFVIAPIFDGSGMKTKVAEALMYGKKVIGTPEAFSGYGVVTQTVGWQCLTDDEFVAAITCAQSLPFKAFDPELRDLYEEKYSFAAAKKRLTLILKNESL